MGEEEDVYYQAERRYNDYLGVMALYDANSRDKRVVKLMTLAAKINALKEVGAI